MEFTENPKHLRFHTDKSEEPKPSATKPTLHIGRVAQDPGVREGAVLERALKIKEDQRGASGPVAVKT